MPIIAPVPVGPGKLELRRKDTGESRIVLDDALKARLRTNAERGTPAFRTLAATCEQLIAKPVAAGYEAFNWSNAIASLSLCWQATSDDRYAAGAVAYLQALLDDRHKVGDGKGGPAVCTHDNGYGIRSFGAYSALGYDWLRKAPAMTPELERRIVARLDEWLNWYGEKGYLRDNAISNYFWGYLTTLTFAGLAFHGEAPQAERWLARSRELLSKTVLPTFKAKMHGGYWPEGWQYGEYTALEIALIARSYKSTLGIDLYGALPWLAETVPYHVHALSPDHSSVYDGGTWTSRPVRPSALAMSGVALSLEGVNEQRASEARWLVRRALPRLERENAWVAFLTDNPDAPDRDPRARNETSFRTPGASVTFMRSDWSKNAVWLSFQAGPRLAEDHQHKDEGHFGLWRGGDALLVDGGGGEGDATINHNTILVDDGGRCLTYTPNQGLFGTDVKTTRFADDGQVAVVAGDIGDAYAPACARDGCTQRAVSKLIRTLVYVRPATLVVHDDVVVTKNSDKVIWAAHTTTSPSVNGASVSAVVGSSRVSIQSIFPEGATIEVRKEPTESGPGVHRKNQPWGPMWRTEILAPPEGTEHRFVNLINADDSAAKPNAGERLAGRGLNGVLSTMNGRRTAVVFADDESGGEVSVARGTRSLIVAGLGPGKRYRARISAERGCKIELRAGEGERSANAGGLLTLSLTECEKP